MLNKASHEGEQQKYMKKKRGSSTTNLNPQFEQQKFKMHVFTFLFSIHVPSLPILRTQKSSPQQHRKRNLFITHFSLCFFFLHHSSSGYLVCTWFMNLKWNVNGINFEKQFAFMVGASHRVTRWRSPAGIVCSQLPQSATRHRCENERKIKHAAALGLLICTQTTAHYIMGEHEKKREISRNIAHFMHFKWRNASSRMQRVGARWEKKRETSEEH